MSAGQGQPSYGVTRRRMVADAVDAHVEEIDVLGFTVVDSGLDATSLSALREALDRLQAREPQGEGAFAPDRDLIRCPLAHDDAFTAVATLPPVLAIARRIFGDSFVLLQQNAILNRPERAQHQSHWHRDLPYQHFVATQKLAISALLCVDDFTSASGGTVVLPGSQMFEAFPSDGLLSRCEQGIEAPAGSVLVMDAMLFHRAGANVSPRVRRGVNHLIGRPLLAQQIDIPRMLAGRHADDPFLNGYLGYRWNPAADVETWRGLRS